MPRKNRDDQHEREIPPIPDGGLSSSMPEWLQRPPAWRSLPDQEVAQTEPELPGALPEADTSEIDPRTFIYDDDLPMWLRSLQRPSPTSGQDAGMQPQREDGESPATTIPVSAEEAVDVSTSVSPSQPFQPRRPPIPAIASGALPEKREITVRPDRGIESPREQTRLTVLLSAALTVAIIVIIVLLVA